MKNFAFRRQLMFVVFMLLGCMTIHATDDDLITEQIIVKLDKAGTLPDKISDSDKYKITNLKIIGDINGTDLRLIRDMAGMGYRGQSTDGNLSILDLSEAKIVKGGNSYFVGENASNDVIGDNTFFNCFKLTSITIPSNVTRIGRDAFYGCIGLTSFTIPSSVTSIDYEAFKICTSLTNINIPYSVTSIGYGAFQDCSSLVRVSIPLSVTSIKESTFEGCRSLTNFTIPYSITSIGYRAFSCCTSLTNINIPSNVTSIGYGAFSNCTGLTSVCVNWKSPLEIDFSTFEEIDKATCTLYVPQGTKDNYRLSSWGDFENIVEYDVTGVDNVSMSNDVKKTARYGADGQRLEAPVKGFNIVRYSDGSVRKIAVQ